MILIESIGCTSEILYGKPEVITPAKTSPESRTCAFITIPTNVIAGNVIVCFMISSITMDYSEWIDAILLREKNWISSV